MLGAVSIADNLRHSEGMTGGELKEVMRQWLQELVDERTGGNINKFAKITGIKEPSLNKALNSKGRSVSFNWIVSISQTEGFPRINEIFAELAARCAVASTRTVEQTQREKLEQKFASGEVQARASSAAQSRLRGGRPEHPKPPAAIPATKTDDRG